MRKLRRPFVVLEHTPALPAAGGAGSHFDLLIDLDEGAPLMSWRLASWPPGENTAVIRQPDHRRLYLEYEGAISGGRGTVRRVDAGACDVASEGGGEWLLSFDEFELKIVPVADGLRARARWREQHA